MSSHLIAVLAYPQLCTFEFACTTELFALARPELGTDWYQFAVCAEHSGPLAATGGISIQVPYDLTLLERADTIIIPGWHDIDALPSQALIRHLQAASQRGARICSICSGVFVLAGAGLLTGKTVSTHWKYADQLAERYPELRVNAEALYIESGNIVSSAGSAAGLDMMLHLIRRDHGARIANQVAQRLVIPAHRDGGQAQFIPRPVAPDPHARLARLMDYLRRHAAQPHTLSSMAHQAAMSERSLQRHFLAGSGMTPQRWLTRERLAQARDLLETSQLQIAEIASTCGFGSEQSLRKHFRDLLKISPQAYRRQFQHGN